MSNKVIKVVVGGNNATSVSDEYIKEELAKKGIIGEIEIVERIEGDVLENKKKPTNSTKKKKNKNYWEKSQFWE